MFSKRKAISAAAVVTMAAAATLVLGTPAQATPPGPGVVGTVIAQKTVGDTDYILREITIPAGRITDQR
ncbi:hypothetical protein ACIBO2_44735 [Nonomuraea sp. NPDC050022]|uniref:hypothetical protein n=1 Tax=unclassified Nonomuraea TaxID=2593643 RepID=UPI003408AC3E